MNNAVEIGILMIAGVYAVLLIVVYVGFLMRTEFQTTKLSENKISVVVAVRNEEKNIAALLNALSQQTIQPAEVIIVDDASEDKTASIVREFKANYLLKCISSDERGKKAALSKGISSSHSEVILITDGDCIPRQRWVESYSNIFSEGNTMFAAGLVKYSSPGGILRHVLQTEMIFLQVASAGLYEIGMASMCNGASMGFTRKFFNEAGGFTDDKFVSGDDVMLLHKAMQHNKSAVKWNYDRDAMVTTDPAQTFPEAIKQRHRWISKFKGYRSVPLVFTAVIFLLVQLLIPAAIISTLLTGTFNNPLAYAAGGKILVELLLLSLAAPYFGEQKIIPVYPLSVILYDVISLGAAFRMFRSDVTWKDRKWRKGKLA